ncbi:sensor histidine kinase [Haloarchaeobius salinus]|uniref:sensor histidine kinase n=1 Tax=Haloarchaeobius salinus TaxID=1198298 RepID=UPI0021097694|nr:GAF domain-containing sensor histidine kinase [Haloarchaeobius salinus]
MDASGDGVRSSIRVGVAVLDERERHVFANGEYASLYGYDDPAELLDEPWRQCLPSSHHDCVADGLSAVECSGRWFGTVREFDNTDCGEREYQLTFVRSTTGETVVVVREGDRRRSHEDRLAALNEATQDLFATERTSVIAKTAIDVAKCVFDQPFVTLWLASEDTEDLVPVAGSDAARVLAGSEDLEMRPIPPDTLEMRTFESGERSLVRDYSSQPDRAFPDLPLSSVLLVPVGEYGLLGTSVPHAGDVGEETVELLTLLARNVGVALDRASKHRELERRNERLDQFTGVVSHDLRGPLSIISGNVELARETGDTSYLDNVDRAVERMDRLIDEVLTLAREGLAVGEPEQVSLVQTATRAWRSLPTGDATLVVDDDATVHADPERLQTVFENLFRNSVEHGRDDVTVTVEPTGDGFAVSDDGPGIPADERTSVFDRGFTTSEDGTGFGLAIVETVAEGHGWTVSVTESDAGGARFVFEDLDVRHGARRTVSEH